jgi:hypothetical protein
MPGRCLGSLGVAARKHGQVGGNVLKLVAGWPENVSAKFVQIVIAAVIAALPGPADGASFFDNGITFSDELGGLVLEKVTGEGSMDDPFVVTERMTDPNGGTLLFRVDAAFGNRIGSQHTIGFALIKVIENATNIPWTSFELELQSKRGIPSDYFDGLSFGQGSNAGRPFTATGFDRITVIDEPYDRIEFDHGRVAMGGRAILRFVISETLPLSEAYLVQRPTPPVADGPAKRHGRRVASN